MRYVVRWQVKGQSEIAIPDSEVAEVGLDRNFDSPLAFFRALDKAAHYKYSNEAVRSWSFLDRPDVLDVEVDWNELGGDYDDA